ncbi:hypothetical protein GCM10010339_52800 [Streptomyces alanosinicus]|uniref:Uncharacterized protein n=1 Tax=Streptomyces alanosinicus TaxID=68171 RepID=A0A919D4W3_9ACTN|nr:hypothetical protein GCM10010339_52800 [Streptomyces alanosinicus]
MPLVTAALLPLGEVLGGVADGDGVLEGAVALAVFEVVHGAAEVGAVVEEDADRHEGGEVAQVPVGPVVGDDGAVVPGEEVEVHRAEDRAQHLLEAGEREVRVVADEFGGGRELVAVDPGGQEPVGVASDGGEGGRPGVEDGDRGVAVGLRAADPPPEGGPQRRAFW